MGAEITRLEISPDGKEVGFFLTFNGQSGMISINLDSFSNAFPALQNIYNELCKKVDKGSILTNDGQPLKVLELTKPDEQTRTFHLVCRNVNGDKVSMPFTIDDAHKMVSGLQMVVQSDKHIGAPIPVQSFATISDWTEEQKEHVGLQFTDENSVNFSFLFTIPQILELLRISEETVKRVSSADRHKKIQ